LLNHGYGGQNTAYQFVARNLVAHGYYVVSIQQDLPTDEPMPLTGNIYQTRYPFWERGVQTLLFTRQAIYRRNPALKRGHLLLAGHSNGGDMVMLFAREHPKLVEKIISLDNRRVPFPRQRRPQVLSLRSSDQVADPGVIPSPAEQARLGTLVVALPATIHNDMWDGATALQQQEMSKWISRFLEQ
jgi:pimeloyl-ACP methyl ester carboxylesterase